ncbi:MAG: RNA methyltransferase [Chitinophagaceae bacterium]|nr:RNA methyltransferase [Chitinophagaceae bacterium]
MLGKQKAKYIQSLGQKKQRDEEGLFIAEGPKIVAELLASTPESFEGIYAVSSWLDVHGRSHPSVNMVTVTSDELEKISQLKTPNQVVAVLRKFEEQETVAVKGKISLVLDSIRDPGNLGTIIRIADWFGLSQVICSLDCADAYNPKVVQATMGSVARVRVFYTDIEAWLPQQHELNIYGTMLDGKDVTRMDRISEGLIIVGNESTGIRLEVAELVTEKITIPGKGGAESLNAGVAVGIVLSHLL